MDFVRFLFEERGGLYGYFRMETTARDYVEGGMEKLRFTVSLDDAQWFSGFLQKYRYTCNPHYYLDFGWGLSSGENNLLRLFTSLYYIFERDYANEKNGDYQIYNYDKTHGRTACDSVILIMDESDLTYHPEWQRRFLSVITAFLQEIYPAQCCREMQILLSTHSPLLLGDMPRDNVVYLRADEKTGMTQADGFVHRIEQELEPVIRLLADGIIKSKLSEMAQSYKLERRDEKKREKRNK